MLALPSEVTGIVDSGEIEGVVCDGATTVMPVVLLAVPETAVVSSSGESESEKVRVGLERRLPVTPSRSAVVNVESHDVVSVLSVSTPVIVVDGPG